MSYIKNYRYWLLTESEDLQLPEEPVSSEESASYVETKLNEGTNQNFQVVSLEEDDQFDDLFAVFADDEQKQKYDETKDPEVAEFLIFRTQSDFGLDNQDESQTGSEQYGFTYLVEDNGSTEHEEHEEVYDSLDECLEGLVEFINSESDEEDDEVSFETEPQSVGASGFEDEGDLKSKLDAKKADAADKKKEYLALPKGSPERDALSKEMIELNREIMELEKQLNKKMRSHTDLGDEDEFGDGGQDNLLFEKKKSGIEVKKYHDWSDKKSSKKSEKKEDKKEDKKGKKK